MFGILFLKIFFWAYNFFIFVLTFQWKSSEFFLFQAFQRVSKPTRINEKHHSFHNTVSLKKPHSFYAPQLTSQQSQKPFWFYKFLIKLVSVLCQKKHFHFPRTSLLKHFESKYLYIIFLYIFVRTFLFQRRSKILSRGGKGLVDWIISLRQLAVEAS